MWTDSPTLVEITNMLPALKQRAKYNANNSDAYQDGGAYNNG